MRRRGEREKEEDGGEKIVQVLVLEIAHDCRNRQKVYDLTTISM